MPALYPIVRMWASCLNNGSGICIKMLGIHNADRRRSVFSLRAMAGAPINADETLCQLMNNAAD